MLFGLITGGLCYVISWIGMIVAMVLIHRLVQEEKKRERKSMRGREQTNKLAEPSLFMFAMHQNVHMWNEIRNVGLVAGLFVAYLLLMAPYIVRTKLDQIVQVKKICSVCMFDLYRAMWGGPLRSPPPPPHATSGPGSLSISRKYFDIFTPHHPHPPHPPPPPPHPQGPPGFWRSPTNCQYMDLSISPFSNWYDSSHGPFCIFMIDDLHFLGI
jgi:hypothetical protein